MGKRNLKPDAAAFAERLNAVLDGVPGMPARDYENAGPKAKGRGGELARLYGVSKATGGDWVRGQNVPEPLRVLDMARRWKVPFMWLYFGEGSRQSTTAEPSSESVAASQPAIPDPSILREAYLLAYQEAGIENGVPYRLEDDPQRTVSAYAFLAPGRSASEVAEYMGAALRRRDQSNRGDKGGQRKVGRDRTA